VFFTDSSPTKRSSTPLIPGNTVAITQDSVTQIALTSHEEEKEDGRNVIGLTNLPRLNAPTVCIVNAGFEVVLVDYPCHASSS
jgi:hypothetical protein